MDRRLTPREAARRCVHLGHTRNRPAARALYAAGSVTFAQYWNAFSSGLAHANAGKPCPCEECNK